MPLSSLSLCLSVQEYSLLPHSIAARLVPSHPPIQLSLPLLIAPQFTFPQMHFSWVLCWVLCCAFFAYVLSTHKTKTVSHTHSQPHISTAALATEPPPCSKTTMHKFFNNITDYFLPHSLCSSVPYSSISFIPFSPHNTVRTQSSCLDA